MLLSDYEVVYYENSGNGRRPVEDYLAAVPEIERRKLAKFIDVLRAHGGHLDEPYAKKVLGTPFRELIVNFGRHGHRVFYFTTIGKRIILLHAYAKTTQKTPRREIEEGIRNYDDFISYDQGTHQAPQFRR